MKNLKDLKAENKIPVEPQDNLYKVEVKVDEAGRLSLPPEILAHLGTVPGASLHLVKEFGQVRLEPNLHALRRLYLEPTTACNLSCQTCIRHTWSEAPGFISRELVKKVSSELKDFPFLQSIMLAGFGEPLVHRDIAWMVEKLKTASSVSIEITTNGTLLDETMARDLLEAGLDRLWVSFDGSSETSFNDIRRGASFNLVLQNVQRIRDLAAGQNKPFSLGISFVVMRDNINELKI